MERSEVPSLERRSSDTWDWPLQHGEEADKPGLAKKDEAGEVHVKNRRYSWEVDLDLGGFAPEDIDVSVVDGELCIHCEEKEEEADEEKGVRAPPARRPSLRRLQRNYHLPKDVDPKTIHSEITKKGVIRVTALKSA